MNTSASKRASARCGPLAAHWKGGRISHSANGYILLRVNKRYVFEHRFLMEQKLGRKLLHSEHVHHINGVKNDNRLENLVVLSESQHHSLHSPHRHAPRQCPKCLIVIQHPRASTKFCSIRCRDESRKRLAPMVCPGCKESFLKTPWRTRRGRRCFCSISCARKYSKPPRWWENQKLTAAPNVIP